MENDYGSVSAPPSTTDYSGKLVSDSYSNNYPTSYFLNLPPLSPPPFLPFPPPGSNFNPTINSSFTVIGFALSSAFILCVCLRAICLWAMDSRSNPSTPVVANNGSFNNSTPASEGLDEEFINSLPVVQFDPSTLPNKEDSSCSVCLEDYSEKDMVRKLPICGHSFHRCCIDPWLRSHKTCPYCRSTVEEASLV